MGACRVVGSTNIDNAPDCFDAYRAGAVRERDQAPGVQNHRNDFAQNTDGTAIATYACHDSARLPTTLAWRMI